MAAILALASCSTAPVPGPAPGPTPPAGATARIGELVEVGSARVRPLRVIEDSRCAARVQCVWAGRLVLLAEIEVAGGSELFTGNMTLGQPLQLGPESVTLIRAEPQPVAGRPIPVASYRFTFAYADARAP